jgi:cytochrome c biogenesis protein CcmG, thiol:disulfide interchange protein DsbE
MPPSSTSTPIIVPTSGNKKGPLLFGAVIAVLLLTGVIAVVASKNKTVTPTAKLPAVQTVAVTGTALAEMPESGVDPAVNTVAPTINGTSFDGSKVVIPAKGKRTMVVIAAHWCPHCQRELPVLVAWQKSGKVPSDLDVVVLSTAVVPERGNYPPAVWLESIKNPFPVMADDKDSTAATALGNAGFPTMLLIGTDGKVVRRISGEHPIEDIEALDALPRSGDLRPEPTCDGWPA